MLSSLSSLMVLPSWSGAIVLTSYFGYLAIAGSILPGKLVPGAVLSDGTRLHYRCNGLLSLLLLITLLGIGVGMNMMLPTVIADLGVQLFSTTLLFSLLVSLMLYAIGCRSGDKSSSLKSHVTGNIVHDWWYGVQLNPDFLGVDLKFFFVRAGMMGWILINLSILAKSVKDGKLSLSMILYQTYSMLYVLDYFWYEEFMTSTWDIIAERLGFMLVFGDLGWWLLENKVDLTKAAALANTLVFRGSNGQKHVFKKDPKAHIWGKPPKVIGGKLLASGYWGIARHCNYLGDLLLALSFSLPCGASSVVPYFYPIYLLILLIWRERRDEARCRQKYKEIWVEYCRLVPWRILPYVY
ncbi:Delta(14)-sterol reductase [Nymphaea thermarum]|nr:Delta(14)-sterol reductase [Nymphaea thermarum]